MTTTLITQESSALIAEVKAFLESTVTDLEITDKIQMVNATTLGNELQKKAKIIEDARKKEKGVWDAKAKAVQDEFMPILNSIKEKKDVLGSAITNYNRLLEDRRLVRQKEFDDKAHAERTALESFAGKREERLKLYQDKLKSAQIGLAAITNDPQQYNTMQNHIRYLQQKVQEFTEKVVETVRAAAQIVAPIYQPESAAASKGSRIIMEAMVREIDFPAFVRYCVEHEEMQFLLLDESKVKTRIKEKEGRFNPPGLICTYTPKTSFSGK